MTGANGFVDHHLCRRLVDRNAEVLALVHRRADRLPAGLVPRLYEGRLGAAGSDWQRVIFTPGRRVFESLGAALRDAGIDNGDLAGLRAGTSGIADLVKAGEGTPNLLLVLDQFEEFFRLQGEDEADAAE